MKTLLPILTIAAFMTACNTNPGTDTATTKPAMPADTTGFAQFQAWKQQSNQSGKSTADTQSSKSVVSKPAVSNSTAYTAATKVRRTHTIPAEAPSPNETSHADNKDGGTMTSESSNKAMRKSGWSKAAKGAAIGGGTGAVIGGVVSKHNRAAGAVIGGVVGGGVGYGIGRTIDKKDGRY